MRRRKVSVQAEPEPTTESEPTPEPDPAPAPVAATTDSDDAAPGFASRRKQSAPALGGATRSTIAPSIEDDQTQPDTAPTPAALAASLTAERQAAPESETQPQTWAARFLSRRGEPVEKPAPQAKAPEPAAAPAPAPSPAPPARPAEARPFAKKPAADKRVQAKTGVPENADERERMTIFGMREKGEVGGAPKHLGLILTAVLLVILAGVAAWASLFMDDGLASLFEPDEPVQAAQVPRQALPEPAVVPLVEEPATQVALAEPETEGLSDTDAIVLDALREEPEIATEPTVLDEAAAEARYAVTGIWQRAPDAPDNSGLVSLDEIYLTSIDRSIDARDPVALSPADSFDTDQPLAAVSSPPAPGSEFAFDDNGRIVPTPEGALSPDGFTVVLGRPPIVPPPTPERADTTSAAEPATQPLIDIRPVARPDDLAEQTERNRLGGLSLSELASVRPLIRPEVEKTAEEADGTPTAQAVLASAKPRLRPANMAQLVDRAQRATPEPEETQVASAAAAVAPATVTPRIPSTASVARAATVNNAINLRRVNLIGVYGTPSNRRALVRLPNGRYKKVQVGDRLDGGRISAIGDSELRYQKGGRNVTLKIPSS